jgi:FtsH-binding integral membrane protein
MLGFNWLLILGAFMVVGWLATHVAQTAQSKAVQYVALVGFVVAEAIIFVPLLAIAIQLHPGIVESAVGVTLLGTGGLTAVAFITRKDFSFMRSALMFGGFAALGLAFASVIFGFSLGMIFSYCMIALACGYILYDTSNVLHHYRTEQYVGAALALFASVMLLFWYVLRILLDRRR